MEVENAKAILKNLLSTDVKPLLEGSKSAPEPINLSLQPEPFHGKFTKDINDIPLNVPFKMFFVQDGGEIKNAAVIPDHVLNSLKESDPEAHEMLGNFKDPNELNVAFADAGNYLKLSGTNVPFGDQKVYNVDGSAKDRRGAPWIQFWQKAYNTTATKCYIASPWSSPNVQEHTTPLTVLGGHMEYANPDAYWYILPICPGHNNKKFDKGGKGGVMYTTSDGKAVQITALW